MEEKWNTLIEAYLSDNLSNEDQQAFDKALEEPEFRKLLLIHGIALDSFTELQEKKILEDIKSHSVEKEKNQRHSFSFNWIVKIAASIVFILAVLFVLKINNNEPYDQLYSEHFYIYPPETASRGIIDSDNNYYNQALSFYVNEDYTSALDYFDRIQASSSQIELYKAICALSIDDNKAKQILITLMQDSDQNMIYNAEWYLALYYLKEKEIQRTIDLLNPISQDTIHPFKKDAKALLTRLMK